MTADGTSTPAADLSCRAIAPDAEPLARLAGVPYRQLDPVHAGLAGGGEILATHGARENGDDAAVGAAVLVWDLRRRRVIRTIPAPPARHLALAATAVGDAL